MKIRFCNDNNANIHSKVEATLDISEDLGLTDQEWQEMSEGDRLKMVEEWAMENFEYWYEEVEDD